MAQDIAGKQRARIRKLLRERRKMLDLLHEMQWVQPIYNGAPSCSACGVMQHNHESCELSDFLEKEKQ